VFSRPIEAKRFPHVALDSSMAKIPRPGEAIVFCIHMQERNKEKKNYNKAYNNASTIRKLNIIT
jgi:hypothetical protein